MSDRPPLASAPAPAPRPAPQRGVAALAAVLALAALLRLPRVLARWDEVNWMYAAYTAPTVEALRGGEWGAALTGFIGLHPPGWTLLQAVSEILAPLPLLWLLGSAALSWAAVALVGRSGGWLAALCMACGPIQLAYAAEVNDYPMMAAAVAACWWTRGRVAAGRPWWELAICGALAAWVHGLGGIVAGLLALSLGPRAALRILPCMALALLPLAPEVFALMTEPGTYRQPAPRVDLSAADYQARFGLLGALLLPLAARGALAAPRIALVGAGTLAAIWGFQALRVAAPHQFPYWLALGPPFALLVAAGARAPWSASGLRRAAHPLAAAVLLVQGGLALSLDLRALGTIRADLARERGIDLALASAVPGDGVYLLSPPRLADDDKRATSAVLWRLPPWSPMPAAAPYPFDYADHRHGQPRRWRGLTIYVNDWPREQLLEAAAAHPRLWVVAYDHRRDPRYTDQLAAQLGVEPREVGGDLVFALSSE